jgi:two-component system sensor histidine kinase PilS (NtrC family)
VTAGPNVQSTAATPGDITRRELYCFNLYRCLEAVVYSGLVFSPFAVEWVRVTRPMLGQVASRIGFGPQFERVMADDLT